MDHQQKQLERIRAVVDKLPSLSTAVAKVLEICSQPDPPANDLNRVISLDPVLTGQVLKLINSAYYSLANKVTSLTRAIIMLGLNTVKNLALSSTIVQTVNRSDRSKMLPIKNFWTHSIGVGVLAKLLAGECGLPAAEREEFFVAGLLHDLGKIPLGNTYNEVIRQASATQSPLSSLENELLGIDHAVVGGEIAVRWKLNAAITAVMQHHHAPAEADPEYRRLVAIVALADFYVCLFDIGYSGNRFPDATQLPLLLEWCGLEWETLVRLQETVDEEITKAEIFLQI
ncbi:MAG: HDOD domain-containing protein [Desulfobulbus sp.]|jgi:putative nucleotidyltransferase with HDIG domain